MTFCCVVARGQVDVAKIKGPQGAVEMEADKTALGPVMKVVTLYPTEVGQERLLDQYKQPAARSAVMGPESPHARRRLPGCRVAFRAVSFLYVNDVVREGKFDQVGPLARLRLERVGEKASRVP